MKLICLNLWGGRVHEGLMDFFKTHQDVDVFCLQEVYSQAHGKDTIWEGANLNVLADIAEVLPQHTYFYHPHLGDWWGLSLFVSKRITMEEVQETYVHLYKGHNMEKEVLGYTAKNLQYGQMMWKGSPLTIINFHGLWNGQGKTDSEERIKQSEKIAEFIAQTKGEIILCGDFNLLPDTQSIQIIENTGLRNLIREFNITSTRTSHYKKPEKFADYMFISRGLEIKEFKVLQDEVSDHAPLYLELM